MIIQAIILAAVTGGPVVSLLFGGAGVIVWLIAIGLKYILSPHPLECDCAGFEGVAHSYKPQKC